MAKTTTLQTTVTKITRLTNTYEGNARWQFQTTDGKFRTQANSRCSLLVENDFTVAESIEVEVELELSVRGSIIGWKLL